MIALKRGVLCRALAWGAFLSFATPLVAAEVVGRVVDWGARVQLVTPLAAEVAEADCREGSRVAAGAVLYRLEDAPWRAEVNAAEMARQHAELLWREAQHEMERVEELYADGLIAEHERQQARIALAEARGRLEDARARYLKAQQRLGWTVIRAPVSGEVLRCLAQVGETVDGRWRAVVLAEMGVGRQREAAVLLEGGRLALGAEVKVQTEGRRYPGRVVAVRPREDGKVWLQVRFEPETALNIGDEVVIRW